LIWKRPMAIMPRASDELVLVSFALGEIGFVYRYVLGIAVWVL